MQIKKSFIFYLLLVCFISKAQCPWNFTVTSLSGNFSITCSTPTLNLLTAHDGSQTINYSWTGPLFSSTLANVSVTQAGNYTVVATNAVTSCSLLQTFAVAINTIAPTNSVNPTSHNISCGGGVVTFSGTVLNPTINIQHDWYSPLNPLPGGVPIATSNNTMSILSGTISPGIYTLVTTDLGNGCKAVKTVTITSLDAWPTFSVNSTTNYSIGCSPLNQTTLSIYNAASTQTPPATCSFTFLPPTFGGTLAPGPYGGNTSTITAIPGTWSLVVMDNSNNCRTILSVPITQNTVAPNVLVTSAFGQTLTCYHPTLLAVGSSTTANTQVDWFGPPQCTGTPSMMIGPGCIGPNTTTAQFTYANYTVVATNTLNACMTTSIVAFFQNFKPPVFSPIISNGSPSVICGNTPVVLTYSYICFSCPVPFLGNPSWQGPAPQASISGVTSYSCYAPGVYSLTGTENYNGCIATNTINVLSNNIAFWLQGTAPSSSASCNGSVMINPTSPGAYTTSVSMGTLTGNNIINLCYGNLIVCLTNTATGCKKCDSILINAATAIKVNNFDEEFVLYPNPTNSTFYIKNTSQKSGTVKIMNVEGKEIESLILEANKETTVQNLKAGIYFVEIRIENSVTRKKVVVLR